MNESYLGALLPDSLKQWGEPAYVALHMTVQEHCTIDNNSRHPVSWIRIQVRDGELISSQNPESITWIQRW
jgi:hypothetical protein